MARQDVVYAPALPDDLTYRSVEARVLRACKTLRALPDREKRFLGLAPLANSIWRQAVDEWAAYNADDERIKFFPRPHDVSDYLTALSWCKTLDKREFRYIWWRSFDISFSVIGARIGRSDETARRRYEDVMRKVWYEAFTSDSHQVSEAGRRRVVNL
jgi:hypothetical protein